MKYKKVVKKILRSLLFGIIFIGLLFTVHSAKVVYADSFDVYFKTSLNGTTGTVFDNNYSSITIDSGSIEAGVVGNEGVCFTITLKEGYIFEKVVIEDSVSTPESTSTNISFDAGDIINKIEVAVIDTVNAYNKPIVIQVSKLKYGTALSNIEITTNDEDLELIGSNLYDYYYLNPIDQITEPGAYALLMILDSKEFEHFPGDANHNYINTITIDGTYYIDKEVVCDYGLEHATKSINLSADSENHYLYVLAYFYDPGLSVEYIANAQEDVVCNMPIDTQKYIEDAPIEINSTTIPVREGYNFIGWSKSQDGDVISTTTMSAEGCKLYAIWKKQVSEIEITQNTIVKQETTTPTSVVTDIVKIGVDD